MRLPDLVQTATDAATTARRSLGEYASPTLRLGVTGLSRAGKTVFITALVRNLTEAHRLPAFEASRSGALKRAFLEPQPDYNVPRFQYESHLEALTGPSPRWPESTRAISQLRLTLKVAPQTTLGQLVGADRLMIDIVDYPGEWLLDLALMDQEYAQWCARVLARMGRDDHAMIAKPFLERLATFDTAGTIDERALSELAETFRAYLIKARQLPPGLATLGPGRFLMPGDLEGSPLLTFAPIPPGRIGDGAVGDELTRRFDAYRTHVVIPFFRDHFSKLDRQIVLVDALAALNGGSRALDDLRDALRAALSAFRPGATSWLGRLFGDRRIDRVLFAATKADHIPQSSHEALRQILHALTSEAARRAEAADAATRVVALAAIRATHETTATVSGETLACIKGTPIAGEALDGETFDGRTEAAIFPGDLPANPAKAIAAAEADAFDDLTFLRFAPPDLDASGTRPWPHGHLDRAIDYLLSDRLP
ncbi:MAG: YcjX family protein [Pseudomonadota bacterium]